MLDATTRSVDARAAARRRRGVERRGRQPQRPRLPLPLRRGRDQGRRDHHQHPRHRRLCHARGHGAHLRAICATRVPGIEDVVLSAHNHNDLGMAVANTIAAIRGGARQVRDAPSTASASAPAMPASKRWRWRCARAATRCPSATTSRRRNILRTSRLLATITGFDVQPNKAIVGRNAFAHECGIHQDGVLKDASTYEIMTPESVGWTKNSLVLGKHSGRAAFRDKLKALGYDGRRQPAERRLPPLQGPRRPQEGRLRRGHRRPGR